MSKLLPLTFITLIGVYQASAQPKTAQLTMSETPADISSTSSPTPTCIPVPDKSQAVEQGYLHVDELVRPDSIVIAHQETRGFGDGKDKISVSGVYINREGQRIRFDEGLGGNWTSKNAELYVEQFIDVRRQALASGTYLQRIDATIFINSNVRY